MKKVELYGKITEKVSLNTISFIAPCPPDFRSSFTGSGLPYENADIAFDNTPNRGEVTLDANNAFTIQLFMPGSYYEYSVSDGKVLVPPCIYITYNSKTVRILVEESIYFRSSSITSQEIRETHGQEDQWKLFMYTIYPVR